MSCNLYHHPIRIRTKKSRTSKLRSAYTVEGTHFDILPFVGCFIKLQQRPCDQQQTHGRLLLVLIKNVVLFLPIISCRVSDVISSSVIQTAKVLCTEHESYVYPLKQSHSPLSSLHIPLLEHSLTKVYVDLLSGINLQTSNSG